MQPNGLLYGTVLNLHGMDIPKTPPIHRVELEPLFGGVPGRYLPVCSSTPVGAPI